MSARADMVYSGLVKMHAHEISRCAAFRRTGKLSTNQLHQVARDLESLGRQQQLDATIADILMQADALELQREVQT